MWPTPWGWHVGLPLHQVRHKLGFLSWSEKCPLRDVTLQYEGLVAWVVTAWRSCSGLRSGPDLLLLHPSFLAFLSGQLPLMSCSANNSALLPSYKKQWLWGCTALLFSLSLAARIHADEGFWEWEGTTVFSLFAYLWSLPSSHLR